jgi:hypothetical protein
MQRKRLDIKQDRRVVKYNCLSPANATKVDGIVQIFMKKSMKTEYEFREL